MKKKIEKGFKHWHEDLQAIDTPIEAGLGFTCDLSKDFRGKDIVQKQKSNKFDNPTTIFKFFFLLERDSNIISDELK